MTSSIPSRSPINPGPIVSQSGRFQPGDRVRTRFTSSPDDEVLIVTGYIETGEVDVYPAGGDPIGQSLLFRPDDLQRIETSDGGAVPSPAPPSDPTDPAAVGEVPPITPADIPGLYVVSENTAVRPPDSARHRFSSQAGHAANVAGAALVRAQAIAMDRIHQAIDAGQAESRRLGDLDDAAQAIVDAADVWADAEGDVDATLTLSEAVQAWRAVRDGGRA